MEKYDLPREQVEPSKIKVKFLKELSTRLQDIDSKVNGEFEKFKLSSFEQSVMRSLKGKNFGSDKQREILTNIELKVFGESREEESLLNLPKSRHQAI